MSIKRLPAQLANQIAAGEVVERPSSVVKELVENSLDAGASSIEVDIERGGHKRIRIRDNGCGIAKQELELALSPHSTSKIATLDDLENIASLGFRGEALASISSVSRLTLTSKPESQNEAWCASAQGRDMEVDIQPAAHPVGTTIDVCDLFFNTPARRKFLRAEKTEFQHIEDILKRIALSRPRISFLLKHNGKVVKRWAAAKQSADEQRVAQICGKQFAHQAKFVSLSYDGVTLRAWVGGPELMRSATDMQFSFVNGRAMRDKLMLHAVRQAYESVVQDMEQPAYVIFLDLSPADVDVNVHPAKHEVRFQHARHIHDLICRAFQDALREELIEDNQASGVAEQAPAHQYTQDQSVTQDYIRPLQPIRQSNSSSTSSFPSLSPAEGSSRTRAAPQYRPTPVAGDAAQAYTNLMSAPETQYQPLAGKGVLRICDHAIHWLGANTILKAWLTDLLQTARVAQPLLMPVSVAVDQALDKTRQDALSAMHFSLHIQQGKALLKQVPASMRSFPWGRIFPDFVEFISTKPADSEGVCAFLADRLQAEQDIAQQAINWFLRLPEEQQGKLVEQSEVQRPIDEFVAWLTP